jgi:hypothetical protein
MSRHFAATLFALLAVLSSSIAHAQLAFRTYEMGEWGSKLGQTSLVDVDKDGDLDFISGTRGGALSWWEYQAGKWVRHDLGSGHKTDVGGVALDGDGDIDLCSKPWNGGRHVYFRNMLKENARPD